MTVITKPLSQERKDEKLEKIVEVSSNPIGTACDETIVVSDNSRSVSVEITDYSHGRQRPRTSKSASRVLFITKVCLLIPALCSIIMGFSVLMHGILKIGPGRQMYKGYCRVPYPSTFFGDVVSSPSYYGHATFGHGSKPVGLAAGLEGDDTIITGDFVNESSQEYKKEKKIKLMMEKLVQHIVEKGRDKTMDKTMTKPPIVNDYPELTEGFHKSKELKVAFADKQKDRLDKKFELDFDIDIDSDREELQMPELSKGKYLHDFKVNKTAIIDKAMGRCFVFNLNRHDIASPRTLYEVLHGMIKGSFDVNIEQIRQDMTVTFPAVNNFGEYGPVIKNACDGMTTYRLVPAASKRSKEEIRGEEIIEEIREEMSNEGGNVDINGRRIKKLGTSRARRSTTDEEQQMDNNYQEFAGKYIQYNIVNLNEIE